MTRKFIPLSLIIFSFVASLWAYSRLPFYIATHWGLNGQADGYSRKDIGLFLLPIITVIMYAVFLFLPKTDPYKKNFAKFRSHFHNFITVVVGFMFYMHLITILWNLGYQFDFVRAISPAFGVIFLFTGSLVKVARRNWFVGIRTPWTLSSDFVWNRTHQIGAKLFTVSGLLCFVGTIWPSIAFFLILAPAVFSTIFLFAYSYVIYRQKAAIIKK